MTRRQLCAIVVTGAIAILGTASAAQAAPTASASKAKSCSVAGRETTFGPTSISALSVSGVSCREGEKVVRAFQRCRVASGSVSGRCVRVVRRFACRETRTTGPTEFTASVTCSKRGATVRHRYTQTTA